MPPIVQEGVGYVVVAFVVLGVIAVAIVLYGLLVIVMRVRSGADIKLPGVVLSGGRDLAELMDQCKRLGATLRALDNGIPSERDKPGPPFES